MSNTIYNRRSFLSSMAILASATLIAGSPTEFFAGNDTADLEGSWKKFMKLNGAGSFLNFNNVQPEAIPVTAGHRHKAGSIVSFNDAGMLAQPTFIYWGNSSKPADMLIRFFENSAPYKTIRTLNRFEMEAFIQLAGTKQPQELLQLACSNGNNKMNRMQVKTTVKKRRQVHDVTLFENNKAVFSQQLFYNV